MTALALEQALTTLFQQYYTAILAFVLAFVRIAAVLQIFPLFTATNVKGGTRAVLAMVLAYPLVPFLEGETRSLASAGAVTLIALVMKEFLVGIVLGCLVSVPFWGIQSAGDIIDMSRGASAANLSDPVNANENSLAGTILLYGSLALFVTMGGLQVVIGLVYESYGLFRVTSTLPEFGMPFVASVGLLLTKMFTLGIIVAGPLMIVMTAIDLALVFATRIAKQIQVSEFATYFKNLAAAMAIPVYAVFLDQYIRDEWRVLMKFIHDFLRLEAGG